MFHLLHFIFPLIIRYLQNRKLGLCSQVMGPQKEPSSYELRQAESLYPAVLQEGHHPQAWCVPETGLSVCPPCMKLLSSQPEEENTSGDDWWQLTEKKPLTAVLAPALTMHCIDCLLHCALLPNFNILMCNLIAYGNLLSHCIRYVMFYIYNIVEMIVILIVQYFIFTNVNSMFVYFFS